MASVAHRSSSRQASDAAGKPEESQSTQNERLLDQDHNARVDDVAIDWVPMNTEDDIARGALKTPSGEAQRGKGRTLLQSVPQGKPKRSKSLTKDDAQVCIDSLSERGIQRSVLGHAEAVPDAASQSRPFRVGAKVNFHHLLNLDDDTEHFKVIFDLTLIWSDPWLAGVRSQMFLMDGSYFSCIQRRVKGKEDTVDKYIITKPGKVYRGTLSKLVNGAGDGEDSNWDQDEDKDVDQDAQWEVPGHLVHHIRTRALEKLLWSPLDKFTVGTTTTKEEVISRSPPVLLDGMKGKVLIFTKYLAELKVYLDMQDFPFDTHTLDFNVSATVPDTEMVFYDMNASQCRIECKKGSAWEVDMAKQKQKDGTFHVAPLPKGGVNQPVEAYSSCKARLFVKRRPEFYLHNYVFIIFLMTLISFGAFAVPITDVAGRSGITVTMFLTVVSLKLLMANQLPAKPYMTHIEWYVVSAFMLVCLPMLGQVFLLFTFCSGRDKATISPVDSNAAPEMDLITEGYGCDAWVHDADRQLMALLATGWTLLHSMYGFLWGCGRQRPSTLLGPRMRYVFVLILAVGGLFCFLIADKGWYPHLRPARELSGTGRTLFKHWAWLVAVLACLLALYKSSYGQKAKSACLGGYCTSGSSKRDASEASQTSSPERR